MSRLYFLWLFLFLTCCLAHGVPSNNHLLSSQGLEHVESNLECPPSSKINAIDPTSVEAGEMVIPETFVELRGESSSGMLEETEIEQVDDTVFTTTSSSNHVQNETSNDTGISTEGGDLTTSPWSLPMSKTLEVDSDSASPSPTQSPPSTSSSSPSSESKTSTSSYSTQTGRSKTDSKFLTFNEWKQREEAAAEASIPRTNVREEPELEEEEDECPPSELPPSVSEECSPSRSRRRWTSLFSMFTRVPFSNKPDLNDEENREETDLTVKPPLPLLSPLPSDFIHSLSPRPNYASLDCGASVLSAGRGSRSVGSILSNSPDRYMNVPCASKEKWVVLELCQEIEVDTVLVGNLEFFSSGFKEVLVHVADEIEGRGEVGKWRDIGILKAQNVRGLQAFKLPPIPGFYQYVRFDFLSHYGSEHFCPVSNVKVYGATQMEVYRREEGARKRSEDKREVKVLVDSALEDEDATSTVAIPTSTASIPQETIPLEVLIESLSQNISEQTTPTEPQGQPLPSASAVGSGSTSTPPTTESIFGAITRRLNALETNATLSMQYLELQGRWLTERFDKVEAMDGWRKKQEGLMSRLLLELQFERAEMERERILVNNQLMALARDISFEQRLGVAQLLGLLALFFFVAFTRGAPHLISNSDKRSTTKDQITRPLQSPRANARKLISTKPLRPRTTLTINAPPASKFRRYRSSTPPPRFDTGIQTPKFEREVDELENIPLSPQRKKQYMNLSASSKGRNRRDEDPDTPVGVTFNVTGGLRRRSYKLSTSSKLSYEEKKRSHDKDIKSTETGKEIGGTSEEYEDLSSAVESSVSRRGSLDEIARVEAFKDFAESNKHSIPVV